MEYKVIELSQIRVNPYQPRRQFDSLELEELAQSIRSVGILHPPLVRQLPLSEDYELISGERRFRAAELANLKEIPVFIRPINPSVSAQAALIENIQRVDLNPLEIAKACKRLIAEFGLTQEKLAEQIGKKRSTLANYLRLLALPPLIQESIAKEEISMGHAKAILALDTEERQLYLHALIVHQQMNVRQAEEWAGQQVNKKKKLTPRIKDVFVKDIANKIEEKLGTKVAIQAQGKKGKICIDYYSFDDLDRILGILGILGISE